MKKLIRLLGDQELSSDLRSSLRLCIALGVLLGFQVSPEVYLAIVAAQEAVFKLVRRVAIILDGQ